jgi:hypothetical protein
LTGVDAGSTAQFCIHGPVERRGVVLRGGEVCRFDPGEAFAGHVGRDPRKLGGTRNCDR